jgi:hypothetical protein
MATISCGHSLNCGLATTGDQSGPRYCATTSGGFIGGNADPFRAK